MTNKLWLDCPQFASIATARRGPRERDNRTPVFMLTVLDKFDDRVSSLA